MKRTLLSLVFTLALLLTTISGQVLRTPAQIPPTPIAQAAVEEAIRQEVDANASQVLALAIYNTQLSNLKFSNNGYWATAWLNPVDPQSGQIVPAEPGLALAHWDGQQWQVVLQSDPQWASLLQSAPADLMPDMARQEWLTQAANHAESPAVGPFGGYLLPWQGGTQMYLTQSISHPTTDSYHAFDFAKPGYPSGMFDVLAAKGGVVKRAVWHYENGNETNGNYLVLEDTTTSPTTYQLYLHLAKDSIPQELRVIGTQVYQGQFIGVADDTGISTGNHLHFMVHTNPNSYWGYAVDITFDDVDINGGRPRMPSEVGRCSDGTCDQGRYLYTSQNRLQGDRTPPSGNITSPATGTTIYTATLHSEGWAQDSDTGINWVQFTAAYNGTWQEIGERFNMAEPFTATKDFALDWDMCSANVPDGPLSLALKMQDKAGNQGQNLAGLSHYIKHYACPTEPVKPCQPTGNQVAVYADPLYGGACSILPIGSYTSGTVLGAAGNDNIESIRVGANVRATLYMKSALTVRGETFSADDSNLADNLVGANTVSSILVENRADLPHTPVPSWPASGATFPPETSLSLVWDNGGSTEQYQALLSTSSTTVTIPWQTEPAWHLGSLAPGKYTWQVQGGNSSGKSGWSAARTLTIQDAALPATPAATAPFTDTMDSGYNNWTFSPEWDQAADANHTSGGTAGWRLEVNGSPNYNNGSILSADLTSPPITLPPDSAFYLRFWYWNETEGPGPHWDQRWLQLSVDGGPFTNTMQFFGDPSATWLKSPAVSLLPYAGHNIQARFHFETLDNILNAYKGWRIDDFTITETPPPACEDSDNSPAQAVLINYGSPVSGLICPEGDLDYYRFDGVAGDRIGAVITAQSIGSPLDAYLLLLDQDGSSVLAENDDQLPGQRVDPIISFTLPENGSYYLLVKAWAHPSSGSLAHTYNLALHHDTGNPQAQFISPAAASPLPSGEITLTVSAQDSASGVSHVQFFWHPADWQNAGWQYLGEDWNGADGWSQPFTVTDTATMSGAAFYAQAFDWVGNWGGAGAWNLSARPYWLYMPLINSALPGRAQ